MFRMATSTMSGYQAAVSKFRDFQTKNGYEESEITEKVLLHYVTYLHSQNAAYSSFCQIKPAISMLQQLKSGQASAFTERVDRFIEVGKRQAAADKQGVKKATEVKFDTMQKMVQTYMYFLTGGCIQVAHHHQGSGGVLHFLQGGGLQAAASKAHRGGGRGSASHICQSKKRPDERRPDHHVGGQPRSCLPNEVSEIVLQEVRSEIWSSGRRLSISSL